MNNLDLHNSDNWEFEDFVIHLAELFSYEDPLREGETASHQDRLAIPDFSIPIMRQSKIMAIKAYNPYAKPWWKLGCWIHQVVAAQITAADNEYAISYSRIASFKIPLSWPGNYGLGKEQQILLLSPTPSQWQLRCSVPHWHDEIHLTISRYTGEIPDEIAQISSKLTEILERV